MIVQQLPEEVFQRRDTNPIFGETAPGRRLEELSLFEMALFYRDTLLDFFSGTVFSLQTIHDSDALPYFGRC